LGRSSGKPCGGGPKKGHHTLVKGVKVIGGMPAKGGGPRHS